VWLTEDEVVEFLAAAENTKQQISFGLGVRCGLRCKEITEARPRDVTSGPAGAFLRDVTSGPAGAFLRDVTSGPAGAFLRVESGKGDKYRETPIPENLVTQIQTMADLREEDDDEPLVDVSTRTVERWVDRTGEELAEHADDGWHYLTPHDLRRT
jgi:integrase